MDILEYIQSAVWTPAGLSVVVLQGCDFVGLAVGSCGGAGCCVLAAENMGIRTPASWHSLSTRIEACKLQ